MRQSLLARSEIRGGASINWLPGPNDPAASTE
jgi:hypothetical protein